MFGLNSHPKGLRTLFFTEMWERFSYYGMRGILILFLTSLVQNGGLGMDDKTAAAVYGLYTASVYLASLPGGWVADRLIGARNAVFIGGLLIIAGQFTLAVPCVHTFFLGLLLIILGTGLLKPNISVMVGQLYPNGGVKQDSGFTIFYMGINVGSAIGPLLVGYLGEKVNWHLGFAAAGLGMVLGLMQFKLTGHYLGNVGLRSQDEKPSRKSWNIFYAGLAALAILVGLCMLGILPLNPVKLAEKAAIVIVGLALVFFINAFFFAKLTTNEKKRVGVIALLFIASAMFFSGFEQAGSSMNIFAERYTVRDISFLGGIIPAAWLTQFNPVPASWFQSLNPVFIIILAPMVASMWPMLAKHHCNPPLIIKFALGLIRLALGFLILAAGARLVSDDTQVWPTWLIITYLVHTLGELCLSPVGLSTVSKLSPKRLVGQMMGIWFLASSLGNLIAGLVAGHISAEPQEKEPVAIIESADQGERLASTDAAQIAQNNVIEKQNLKDLLDQEREMDQIVQHHSPVQNEESSGILMSRQFMRIFWFAMGVAGLLFILSKPVRSVTREIE